MASVKKQGKNYQITVSLGYNNGKKQIKTKTYVTNPDWSDKTNKKMAIKEGEKFEAEVKANYNRNSNMKFSYYAELYLKESIIKNKTISGYASYLPRINEGIGDMKLCDIKIKTLETFYKELINSGRRDTKYTSKVNLKEIVYNKNLNIQSLAKATGLNTNTVSNCINGKSISSKTANAIAKELKIELNDLFTETYSNKTNLSTKTIQNYHRFISAVFANAVHDEILDKNPCEHCRLPFRQEKKEKVILDAQQAKLICNLAQEEKLYLYAAVVILLESGLRCGELLGLKWDCVDFDNNLITIQRNLCYTSKNGIFVDTVKTTSSNRIIKLPSRSMNLLKDLKKRYEYVKNLMKDLWHEENFVFTRDNGLPMRPDTLGKNFKSFIKKHSDVLPDISLHGLRHTHATLLIEQGINIVEVSRRLGHSNVTTTMNVYAHALQKSEAMAVDKLENIFN